MIKRYKINPRPVMAVQVQQRGHKAIAEWCGGHAGYTENGRTLWHICMGTYTAWNSRVARIGDWIVRDDLRDTFEVYSDEEFRELFSLST